MKKSSEGFLLIVLIFLYTACRKPYDPPEAKSSNHFLAIYGIVNTDANSSSTFILSRSLNLSDSIPHIPELNAHVTIIASSGSNYPLTDIAGNGTYVSDILNLDPTLKYQVSVTTIDGNKYLSDPVTPKVAPPIDSLTWQKINDPATGAEAVNIFVNAHDPTNNTRYYRWDYTETYIHVAHFQSYWFRVDTLIAPVQDPSQSTYTCWTTGESGNILLGSSIALGSDVISQNQIASFAQNDPKMDVRYSILVRQYPLDLEAYNYWTTVQKNSQSLGGLFDLQPAQITGNFHNITNSSNPALGYVSASSVQEKRLFIDNQDLPNWKSNPLIDCPIKIIVANFNNNYYWDYPDTSYTVYYFNTGVPVTINIAPSDCLDCRYQGGTNIQPPFWQ